MYLFSLSIEYTVAETHQNDSTRNQNSPGCYIGIRRDTDLKIQKWANFGSKDNSRLDILGITYVFPIQPQENSKKSLDVSAYRRLVYSMGDFCFGVYFCVLPQFLLLKS